MTNSKKNILKSVYFFLLAGICLILCSRSSFLYPCNNWDDANSYFTMGKGLMNGLVIYRDLYDQKGPYLYLLYGLSYLLSNRTFYGVLFMEIISGALFLFGSYRVASLFCRTKTALALLPVMAVSFYVSKSFYWGGAAEEFCLPLMIWSLYFGIKIQRNAYSKRYLLCLILLNGLFAGIILQLKYTLLGFYIPWIFFILIRELADQKITQALKSAVIFGIGMFLPSVPWIIYFAAHGALDDWYRCYLYNNVFLYSSIMRESFSEKILKTVKVFYYLIIDNFSYFIWIIAGFAGYELTVSETKLSKIQYFFLFVFSFLGIFWAGGKLPYYSIPLVVFAAPGIGFLGKLIDFFSKHIPVFHGRYAIKIFFNLSLLIICILFLHAFSGNSDFSKQAKSDFYLYRFRDIVLQEQNPTLLNVGCLDAGLYTLTGIVPFCEYFQTNGIALPEMFQEQSRYITSGQTLFVLSRNEIPENIEAHYNLVSTEKYISGNYDFTYYLFKRK